MTDDDPFLLGEMAKARDSIPQGDEEFAIFLPDNRIVQRGFPHMSNAEEAIRDLWARPYPQCWAAQICATHRMDLETYPVGDCPPCLEDMG